MHSKTFKVSHYAALLWDSGSSNLSESLLVNQDNGGTKMKKFLTTATIIAIISSLPAYGAEKLYNNSKVTRVGTVDPNSSYLRLDAMGNKFQRSSRNGVEYNHEGYSHGVDIGYGYKWMEKIRAELVYNHNFVTIFKSAAGEKDKAHAKALFLRAMADMIELGSSKIFVGLGVGVARVSHKALNAGTSGPRDNFAYSLHAGVAADIAECTKLEIAWSMRDFGKTKNLSGINGANLKLLTHAVSLGLRFEI